MLICLDTRKYVTMCPPTLKVLFLSFMCHFCTQRGLFFLTFLCDGLSKQGRVGQPIFLQCGAPITASLVLHAVMEWPKVVKDKAKRA